MQTFLILLPALACALLAIGFAARSKSWLKSALVALCIVAGFSVSGAWLLSLGGLFSFSAIGIWWGLVVLVALGFSTKQLLKEGLPKFSAPRPPGIDTVLLFVVLGSCLGTSFLMAAAYYPNNADSMIYHLPRQILWLSHGTVFTDAMPVAHMSKMPPLAEYLGANVFLLSGSDRWLNLVQWTAYAACLGLAALAVKQLGGTREAALFAAVFLATVPAAFLEASNTKNDLVLTAFLLGILVVGIDALRKGVLKMSAACLIGALAGAAMLTKGTAIAFLAAGAVIGLFFLRRIKLRAAPFAVAAMIAFIVAAPHYLPNVRGILEGETGKSSSHANETRDPSTAMSVFVRNVALQSALPSENWNSTVEGFVERIHSFLGKEVNDSASTFMGTAFDVRYEPILEDQTNAPLHFVVIFLMPLLAFLIPALRRDVQLRWMSLLPLLALLIFSLLFRWQPWHSRLLIPCLAFSAPVFALMVYRWRQSPGRIIAIVYAIAAVLWLVPSLEAKHRPLSNAWDSLVAGGSLRGIEDPQTYINAVALEQYISEANPASVVFETSGGAVYPVLRSLQRTDGSWPLILMPDDERAVEADLWVQHFSSWAPAPERFNENGVGKNFHPVFLGDGLRVGAREAGDRVHLKKVPAFYLQRAERGLGVTQFLDPGDHESAFRQGYFPSAVIPLTADGNDRVLRVGFRQFKGANRCEVIANGTVLGAIEVPAQEVNVEGEFTIPGDATFVELKFEEGFPSDYDPEPVAAHVIFIQILPAK